MQYNAVSKRLCNGFALSAIQMWRNELKYNFYRQNPAYFPGIYLLLLFINKALPALVSPGRISWAKMLNIVILMLRIWFTFDAVVQQI